MIEFEGYYSVSVEQVAYVSMRNGTGKTPYGLFLNLENGKELGVWYQTEISRKQAKERIAKVRFWATQAREKARHYEHKEIGYNYRMSNIVAGIGRGQMKVLDQRIEQKRHIFAYYQEHLGDLEGLSFMPLHKNERANCWLSVIQLAPDCKVRPLDMIVALEKEDIETRPVWKPMHMQPVFADCDYIDNGKVGESLFENGVCLPSDTKMTDEDLKRICTIIRGLWK